MAAFRLPIGVRFKPSKLELVEYFLANRLSGQELAADVYPQFLDYDLYTDHPFNILCSTKEKRRANDTNEGYFFSRLKKVTPNGKRISRSIEGHGKWLEKAGTNQVRDGNKKVMGIEKYLMFIPIGGSNKEKEAEWRMHEYSLPGNNEMVLCHVTRKPDSTNKVQTTYAAAINNIMPMEYEAGSSSNKRGRFEYEQSPSGCNNNNTNQDYVSQGEISGYQDDEYCVVPQGNNDDSALIVELSDEEFTKEIEAGMVLDCDDDKDNNQVDDGILQLTELAGDAQNFRIEDMDQFIKDAEQVFGLSNGEENNISSNLELESWSREGFESMNANGFDEAAFSQRTYNDADDISRQLLQLPTA